MADALSPQIEWVLSCDLGVLLEEIGEDFLFYNSDSGDTHVLSPLAGRIVRKLKAGSQLETDLFELRKEISLDLSYDAFRRILNALVAREIIEISPNESL